MDSCSNEIDNKFDLKRWGQICQVLCHNFERWHRSIGSKTLQRGVSLGVYWNIPKVSVLRCCEKDGPVAKDVPKPTGGSFESVNIWGWIWWRVTQQWKRVGRMDKPCLLLSAGFRCLLFSPRTLGKISNFANIFQIGWFNHQPVSSLKSHWSMSSSCRFQYWPDSFAKKLVLGVHTLHFHLEPENTPLEKENHLPNHHFQVLC